MIMAQEGGSSSSEQINVSNSESSSTLHDGPQAHLHTVPKATDPLTENLSENLNEKESDSVPTTPDSTPATSNEEASDEEDNKLYPTGYRLALIVASLCMTVFLFALDGTILATALPVITSELHGLDDVSWYSAAFFITTCAFQLPFGRAYVLLNLKWTYLTSVVIFLIGSAVCGSAPNSIALIIGRAIAGIGGAGVIGGVFIIIAKSIPLRKRSLYTGLTGASLAICSVVGPVIGEVHSHEQHLSKIANMSNRWCLYQPCVVEMVFL